MGEQAACASAASAGSGIEPSSTIALSIVIPILDEAPEVVRRLTALQTLRHRGSEIIVVDGGSVDRSVELARPLADRCLCASRGRARQMNAGAAVAAGRTLLFLHIDTTLPDHADRAIADALEAGFPWGRFDVRIDGRPRLLAGVAMMMNWRSRLTGIATGDQAIFVRRDLFEAVGGYPEIPLMEDIALSSRLCRRQRPACLRGPVVTSGRRWEAAGVVPTILLMWRLRAAYFFGADPAGLSRRYEIRNGSHDR